MRILYKKQQHFTEKNQYANDFLQSCTIEAFKPTLWHPVRYKERADFFKKISRLYFWLLTGGRARVYYLLDGEEIVHTSMVVPACRKFPFLKKNEYEIGPCVTGSGYRRKGSYSYMLEHITTCPAYAGCSFYMIVSDTNIPSIKGIEKAGFEQCGRVRKTKILKNYKLEK